MADAGFSDIPLSLSGSVTSVGTQCYLLLHSLQIPMEKLKLIAPQLLEGDTGWQLRDTYTDCLAEFDKYENKVINKWQERITSQLTEKLKQPVMVCTESYGKVYV